MRKSPIIEHWEAILKKEGMQPIDRYRKNSTKCFVMTERHLYGAQSKKFNYEFFRRCEQFQAECEVEWPNEWSMFSKGKSYSFIASASGITRRQVQSRIESMRNDMKKHFRDSSNDQEKTSCRSSDILEIFVEQQQRSCNNVAK